MSDPDYDPFDITKTPPPPYVVTDEDRERWELAGKLAVALWADNSDEPLDNAWWWYMVRSIYSSEFPTMLPGDAEG